MTGTVASATCKGMQAGTLPCKFVAQQRKTINLKSSDILNIWQRKEEEVWTVRESSQLSPAASV